MLQLNKFDEIYLEMSWKWLNDPEIKKLTNTPDFKLDVQKKWFTQLKYKKDYKIWGLSFNGVPIGVCGIKNITKNDCEYWGYIGEKAYWGQGLGRGILVHMENAARKLVLDSIWLQVIKENERAIKLYQKLGYKKVEEKQGLIFMRKML